VTPLSIIGLLVVVPPCFLLLAIAYRAFRIAARKILS